jgi:hypothetical protein
MSQSAPHRLASLSAISASFSEAARYARYVTSDTKGFRSAPQAFRVPATTMRAASKRESRDARTMIPNQG